MLVCLHYRVSDTDTSRSGTHKTQDKRLTHRLTRITSLIAWTTVRHTEQLRTYTPRNTQRKRTCFRRTVYTSAHRARDTSVKVEKRADCKKDRRRGCLRLSFVKRERPWADAAGAQTDLRANGRTQTRCVHYHDRQTGERGGVWQCRI